MQHNIKILRSDLPTYFIEKERKLRAMETEARRDADNSMQMAPPSMPSMQMPPPSMPSSAAATSNASRATVQPLNLHEKLPFFVYGTLCQGFCNYKIHIEVHPAPTCSARGSHQR